jgi:hypothetical protein
MQYRVVLADSAKADAENLYQWVTERAPLQGPEWFEKLLECLYSLDHIIAPTGARWRRRREDRTARSATSYTGSAQECTASSSKSTKNEKRFGFCIFARAHGRHCDLRT